MPASRIDSFQNAIGASFADPGQVLRKVYQEEDVSLRAYEQALANLLDDQTRALLLALPMILNTWQCCKAFY